VENAIMMRPWGLLPGAGVVLALVVLGYFLLRSGPGQLIHEFWSGPRLAWGTLEDEKQRERDLDARQEALFRCMEAKNQLVREVIAGRLSLLEGAARLRELCRSTPGVIEDLRRRAWLGDTDEERACRDIIARAQSLLDDEPEKAQEVARRLDAELREWLRGSTPALP
jgi:hypothetical protein